MKIPCLFPICSNLCFGKKKFLVKKKNTILRNKWPDQKMKGDCFRLAETQETEQKDICEFMWIWISTEQM